MWENNGGRCRSASGPALVVKVALTEEDVERGDALVLALKGVEKKLPRLP